MIKYKFDSRDWKIFSAITIISLLYIFPIILSGRYYIDDLGRSIAGYSSWGIDGRPLADLVMLILNSGMPLVDLSPLTQILAVTSISYALTLYAKKYFHSIDWISTSFACFLFIGSPFFIENLSYKYDSITMALSASFLILIFASVERGYSKWIISSILILSSLCLYQATIGLFVILSCIESIDTIRDKSSKIKNAFIALALRALALLAAFLIYKLCILKIFAQGTYQNLRSGTVPVNSLFIEKLKDNVQHYMEWLINPFVESIPLYADIIYTAIYLIFIINIYRSNDKGRLLRSVLVFVLIFISIPFFFIHVVILNNPAFVPRVLVSFCGSMLLFGYVLLNSGVGRRYLPYVLSPVIYFCFFYVNAYSSASSAQNRSDQLIASSLYYDISHSGVSFDDTAVIGSLPESDQRKLTAWKLPLTSGLIPLYMANGWWSNEFMKHYRIDLKATAPSEEDRKAACSIKPFAKTKDYNLYMNERRLIIDFTMDSCS